jgi:hypothetical protein
VKAIAAHCAFVVALTLLPAPAQAFDAHAPSFETPSHNIACNFGDNNNGSIYCSRINAKLSRPGHLVTDLIISMIDGFPSKMENTDVITPFNLPVLAYGKSITYMRITCTSRKTGLDCRQGPHGFVISQKIVTFH